MGLVTGLAWVLGQIVWSVHMRNFSPVNRDIFQEAKPKWWNVNLYALWTLVHVSYKS